MLDAHDPYSHVVLGSRRLSHESGVGARFFLSQKCARQCERGPAHWVSDRPQKEPHPFKRRTFDMSIPGFTAERSVAFRTPWAGLISRRRSGHLKISPAAIDLGGECISRCSGDPECAFLCQTSGDIGGGSGAGGGGAVPPHCNVGCGPCQQIRGKWQRGCVQANCSVHYVACRPT